jgi:hypothetical protein
MAARIVPQVGETERGRKSCTRALVDTILSAGNDVPVSTSDLSSLCVCMLTLTSKLPVRYDISLSRLDEGCKGINAELWASSVIKAQRLRK